MQKTVLLVEAEDRDLALFRDAFREAGYAEGLQVVRSSAEAIRFIAGETPYDNRETYPYPALLLLGLSIGKHAGADVLRWLQHRGEMKKHLPVVVLSSVGSPQEMEAAYAWGANSYVVKPAEFNHLVTLVRDLADYWLKLNRLPQFYGAA